MPIDFRLLVNLLKAVADPEVSISSFAQSVRLGPGSRMPRCPKLHSKKRKWRIPEQREQVDVDEVLATQGVWNKNYSTLSSFRAEVEEVLRDQAGTHLRDQERAPAAPDLKRLMREKARRGHFRAGSRRQRRVASILMTGTCWDVSSTREVFVNTVGTFGVSSASCYWGRVLSQYLISATPPQTSHTEGRLGSEVGVRDSRCKSHPCTFIRRTVGKDGICNWCSRTTSSLSCAALRFCHFWTQRLGETSASVRLSPSS